MVSEFRRKKLAYLFKIFFFGDENKAVNKEVFEKMTDKVAKARGWVAGDVAYKQAETIMAEVWDGIQKMADKNNDGEISLDEWISLWDEYAKNPSDPASWQEFYCKAIFFIQDASGDGAIDHDEFVNVHVSFGASKEETSKAFEKVANGKTSINWEDFQKLWKEFFISEDENAPGNFIFGNLEF